MTSILDLFGLVAIVAIAFGAFFGGISVFYRAQSESYYRGLRNNLADTASKIQAEVGDAGFLSGHAIRRILYFLNEGNRPNINYIACEDLKPETAAKRLFNAIREWQTSTFGNANSLSKLAHLQEELDELQKAIKENDPNRRFEYADCFLLLYGAAGADGMTYDDIFKAIEQKLAINKKRKWGKPDANGVVHHVKSSEDVGGTT
jgi:NTP pyrophosphatase (non-canonical NTP hydrolase)